jgi:t-SNARE complex subunit (syntaxin)
VILWSLTSSSIDSRSSIKPGNEKVGSIEQRFFSRPDLNNDDEDSETLINSIRVTVIRGIFNWIVFNAHIFVVVVIITSSS